MSKKIEATVKPIAPMTMPEFRAWLEGFEESMSGAPNKAQWEKIKARLDMVKANETVVYRDYYDYWKYRPYWVASSSYTRASDGAIPLTSAIGAMNAINEVNPSYATWYANGKLDSEEE